MFAGLFSRPEKLNLKDLKKLKTKDSNITSLATYQSLENVNNYETIYQFPLPAHTYTENIAKYVEEVVEHLNDNNIFEVTEKFKIKRIVYSKNTDEYSISIEGKVATNRSHPYAESIEHEKPEEFLLTHDFVVYYTGK